MNNIYKFQVVCGVCIIMCKTLRQARIEAKRFNRKTIDGLIDYWDNKKKEWRELPCVEALKHLANSQ